METLKDKVLKAIDRNKDLMFDDLAEIVRIPSVVGSEGKAQEWVLGKMRSIGLEVQTFEANKQELMKHPSYVRVDWPYEGRPTSALEKGARACPWGSIKRRTK